MIAKKIYNQLENDFIKPLHSDDWYKYMTELEPFICDSFKNRSIGLVCDFTETVHRVYTAVFPSENVLQKVINNSENAMLFVHHASNWSLKKSPVGFYPADASLLEMLRKKHISVYCLHIPLDDYGEYSTSKTLADALDIEIIKPFVDYNGAVCGVIGKTKCKPANELNNKFSEAVGHETKLYQYGDDEIPNNRVAVCAGGGNQEFVINELIDNNINALITGISVKNNFSAPAHKLAENNQINIFGGTHYSTEKFACIAMCKYFSELGLHSEFIEDEPCFEDL
jgi:putative NIF3 family GTP cyclohydrolase 1 type 2